MALVMLPCDLPSWADVQNKLVELREKYLTLPAENEKLKSSELLRIMKQIYRMCCVSLDPDETLEEKGLKSLELLSSFIDGFAPACSQMLTRRFVASLLAAAFFCTFPKRTTITHPSLTDFNFDQIYRQLPQSEECLWSIFEYFDKLYEGEPKGFITVKRKEYDALKLVASTETLVTICNAECLDDNEALVLEGCRSYGSSNQDNHGVIGVAENVQDLRPSPIGASRDASPVSPKAKNSHIKSLPMPKARSNRNSSVSSEEEYYSASEDFPVECKSTCSKGRHATSVRRSSTSAKGKRSRFAERLLAARRRATIAVSGSVQDDSSGPRREAAAGSSTDRPFSPGFHLKAQDCSRDTNLSGDFEDLSLEGDDVFALPEHAFSRGNSSRFSFSSDFDSSENASELKAVELEDAFDDINGDKDHPYIRQIPIPNGQRQKVVSDFARGHLTRTLSDSFGSIVFALEDDPSPALTTGIRIKYSHTSQVDTVKPPTEKLEAPFLSPKVEEKLHNIRNLWDNTRNLWDNTRNLWDNTRNLWDNTRNLWDNTRR
ncbi:unnamed protein product [Cyprideis torosa]|uniref:PARG helical domain-containing protein n=1 Tax=Cyprideis torosa TaxID=163714 RepID=A0A7R8W956_9CRUS|nr:unnamed protein product [Cyprideis torosa]CAG0883949.1 unnamed protein product [Cyprideis torosa]